MSRVPSLLECTLRDGSYAVNFQFTKEDTVSIVRSLDEIGLEYIEIGHGMGLGAEFAGGVPGAENDETYMISAASVVKKAKLGVFCIPGIASLDDVQKAADCGMSFIRVGTNIEEYEQAKEYVHTAKKYGMMVCANFMKSYVCTPDAFSNYALYARDYGADYVYLVDSAGGMLPEELTRYIEAVKVRDANIKIGFHGHNNLGLATANALVATKLGVDIVDTSMQGLGRSSGNVPTEQFLCVLIRNQYEVDIDPIALMDVSEKLVLPFVTNRGVDSIDLISGLGLFHSSYMPLIKEYSIKYKVDPRKLILAVSEQSRVDAPRWLVESSAIKLSSAGVSGVWKPLFKHYYGGEQEVTREG